MMKEYLNKIKNDIQSCKGCRCCKIRYNYSHFYSDYLYCEKYQKYTSNAGRICLKEQYKKLKEECNCNKSHISIIKIIKIIMDAIIDICVHIDEALKDIYYHRNEVDKDE